MGMIQIYLLKKLIYPTQLTTTKQAHKRNCLQVLFEEKTLFISTSSIQLYEQ